MLGIVSIKVLVLLLMLCITFVASMLPLAFVRHIRRTTDVNKKSRYQSVLSLLSCFAGGVFMGTCILDLFPDVQEQIDKVMATYPSPHGAFPVAEFIVVFGFLLVMTMEQIVLWFKEKDMEIRDPATSQLLSTSATEHPAREALHREHSIGGVSDRPDLTGSIRSTRSSVTSYGAVDRVFVDDHEVSVITLGEDNALDVMSLHSPLRSMMLLFALSLHSVFEGMAVGLQASIDSVVSLFVIVIFHKGIIALSLGLNMVQSRLTVKMIVLSNIFFCLTAPLGIGVGIAISSMDPSPAEALISGGLQGLACGTFLYVTFFEVLPHEMNCAHMRLGKNVCIILGFSAVCAMMYIEPSQKQLPHAGDGVLGPSGGGNGSALVAGFLAGL